MNSIKIVTVLCIACIFFSQCKKDSVATIPADCSHNIIYADSPFVFVLPTAFTPNFDGKNDVYKPTGIGITDSNYLLTVTKQNGQVVFQSSSHTTGWNGKDTAGAPATDYLYNVSLQFTDNLGHKVDTCSYLYLLTTDASQHCIQNYFYDIPKYLFTDQVDPLTGKVYVTTETFCP